MTVIFLLINNNFINGYKMIGLWQGRIASCQNCNSVIWCVRGLESYAGGTRDVGKLRNRPAGQLEYFVVVASTLCNFKAIDHTSHLVYKRRTVHYFSIFRN